MPIPLTDALRAEYQNLFDTCQVRPERLDETGRSIAAITQNRARYESAGTPLGIPWFFIAVIHCMEASMRFTVHLHNGDPLTARTVHVPAGRPVAGEPPFTWELSATDALTFEGVDKAADWTLPGALYQIEKYNGFGYRTLHPEVLSPYLWSGTNHYTSGKYVADGKFDPDAVSQQCGAAAILRRMAEQNLIPFQAPAASLAPSQGTSVDSTLVDLASQVSFSTSRKSAEAEALQRALNTFPGIALVVDGVAGPKTSDAVRRITGDFLDGDPRQQTQALGS